MIEARTWRWRGHWAADDQSYRSTAAEPEVEDPLDLFAYRLLERGVGFDALRSIHAEVEAEVAAAVRRAAESPDAGAAELGFDDIYA